MFFSAAYEAEKAGMSQERLDRIAPALSKYISSGQIPGLITAVARKGEVVHFEVQGFADVEQTVPLKKDSLFRIYSMSKPITGVALMILIEEGKIRLTDPVSDYIPEFSGTEVLLVNEDETTSREKIKRPLTIRDLATHTSGIAYSFTANKPLQEIYKENKLSPYFFIDNLTTSAKDGSIQVSSEKSFENICAFSSALAKAPLMHQPGEKWTYSMGMDVLGCVIEKASGQTFDRFLEERIFAPLGMTDTSFYVPKSKVDRFTNLYFYPGSIGNLIPGMEKFPKDLKMMLLDHRYTSPYLKPATLFDGGSGLVSSTQDYLRFSQMLLNGGILGKTRILSRKSVELFSTNHLSKKTTQNSNYYPEGMGFGITVGITSDIGLTGEHGSNGSYYWGGAASTLFWVDPEEDLVAVAMTQLMASPLPLRTEFTSLVYQAIDD